MGQSDIYISLCLSLKWNTSICFRFECKHCSLTRFFRLTSSITQSRERERWVDQRRAEALKWPRSPVLHLTSRWPPFWTLRRSQLFCTITDPDPNYFCRIRFGLMFCIENCKKSYRKKHWSVKFFDKCILSDFLKILRGKILRFLIFFVLIRIRIRVIKSWCRILI